MARTDTQLLRLTVAEALPKDVGRGIARMDPRDMPSIGVQVGDIVQVVGKRATAAKVMPAYSEDRGKGIVQIDGITRENAQKVIEAGADAVCAISAIVTQENVEESVRSWISDIGICTTEPQSAQRKP